MHKEVVRRFFDLLIPEPGKQFVPGRGSFRRELRRLRTL